MPRKAPGWIRHLVLGVLVFLPVSLLLTAANPPQRSPSSNAAPDQGERERLLGIGKKLFVERCASCHGERGDKPLKTGPPLSQRKLEDQVVESAVKGRLRDKTEEQKRGVALYIESLLPK